MRLPSTTVTTTFFTSARLRSWLMEQKVAKLKTDGNKAAAGGNWPVFDFCNQFLQVRQSYLC